MIVAVMVDLTVIPGGDSGSDGGFDSYTGW